MTLREARQAAHMTQATLARRLGLRQTAISSYEVGDSMPSVTRAREIEDILGVLPGSIVFRRRETSA